MLQPFLHQKKSDCSKPVRTGKNYIEYDSNGSNTINQRKFSNCFFFSNAFPIKKNMYIYLLYHLLYHLTWTRRLIFLPVRYSYLSFLLYVNAIIFAAIVFSFFIFIFFISSDNYFFYSILRFAPKTWYIIRWKICIIG